MNGFEVHDPEEAVLLFLEQDQDITLTVARPLRPATAKVIICDTLDVWWDCVVYHLSAGRSYSYSDICADYVHP